MLLLQNRAGSVAQKGDADEGKPQSVFGLLTAALYLVKICGYYGDEQKGESYVFKSAERLSSKGDSPKKRKNDGKGNEHTRQSHRAEAERLVACIHRKAKACAVGKTEDNGGQMKSEAGYRHNGEKKERRERLGSIEKGRIRRASVEHLGACRLSYREQDDK